jgi:hypothetical protein
MQLRRRAAKSQGELGLCSAAHHANAKQNHRGARPLGLDYWNRRPRAALSPLLPKTGLTGCRLRGAAEWYAVEEARRRENVRRMS